MWKGVDDIRLYLRYVDFSLRSQMEYRGSFLMQAFSHFAVTGLEFLGLAALFQRFGQIQGWTLPQIGLFYGIISVSFAIVEGVARGFDIFSRYVNTGDFDRILLRPRSTALQVLGRELQLMRAGRLFQGMIVLTWSALILDIQWTAGSIVLLFWAIAGGVCVFGGLFILQATMCFWTTESLEIVNCTTYGGVDAAQFPLTIYRPWFRAFFTFVIPLAAINYFPAHAILNRADPLGSPLWFQWISPVIGVIFLMACLKFWRFGVKRYTSTGS
jgi:ABC-2 type transport system permease protein